MFLAEKLGTAEISELSEKYIMSTYGRIPMAPVRGAGARLWDAEGKEYLDFVAGIAVNSLGHCPEAVVRAIQEQATRLMHVSNLYLIENQVKLAKLLVENSCATKAFFCNSGAEANEAAIKLARKWGKKQHGSDCWEIITAVNSFHGRTLGALTATGQPKYQSDFEPLPKGFKYVPFNDLAALTEAVDSNTCAIMLEPVQGESGIHPATLEYLCGVRNLCDKKEILLIFDEVQCGLGRTGTFLAYQQYNVEPDVFTLAKALGGGFPIGAMLAKEHAAMIFGPGDHASTFGGNPLACAAAIAVVETLLNEGVLENCCRVGTYFKEQLQGLSAQYNYVREVRGLGLMLGMELTILGADFVSACREQGLLINCTNQNVLRFVPPLIITQEDVNQGITILSQVMDKV